MRKNFDEKINAKLNEHVSKRKWYQRITSLVLSLTMVLSFITPLDMWDFIKTGYAASQSVVPVGSYEINNDVTNVDVTGITGGTLKIDETHTGLIETPSGATIQMLEGEDFVKFKMNVEFEIDDESHDKINYANPYVYLSIPKDQLYIMTDITSGYGDDTSDEWREYRRDLGDEYRSYPTGDYDIYTTDNDDYGYVVLKFNKVYLDYLAENNGFVQGALELSGQINRANLQNGEKVAKIGSAEIKVEFDNRVPTVEKTGRDIYYQEDLGCPTLEWTITVKDLYETSKYPITDNMLKNAVDGKIECNPPGVCYLDEDGKITFNNTINDKSEFTITYKTKVTKEQLEGTDPVTFKNEVSLNGEIKDEATVTVTPNSAPTVKKSGKPDYQYNGERKDELDGKNYIYWEVEVNRNYGLPLRGYTLIDTPGDNLGTPELVGAKDKDNKTLELNDLFTSPTGTEWTFKDSVTESKVVLTYRTTVTADQTSNSNTIKVDGGNSTDSDPVYYDKKGQHSSSKTGRYDFEEGSDGVPVEYVDWEIKINVENTDNNNEIINGYTIEDSAFSAVGFQWLPSTARVKNGGYINITADDMSQWISISGNTGTVGTSKSEKLDQLVLKYRVPLGDVAGRTATTGGEVVNTYKVEDDDPDEAKVTIPSLAGSSKVSVSKQWDNNDDTRKNDTQAVITLWKKIGTAGEWEKTDKTITITGENPYQNVEFTDLPAYDVDSSGNRTPIYYKVTEEIITPTGVENLYKQEFTSGDADNGAKASSSPSFGLKNTWEGVNVGGTKHWKDDESNPDRPSVSLRLEKKNAADEWVKVNIANNPISVGNSNGAQAVWNSLPKYENGQLIEYRVVEDSVPAGYTPVYNGNEITNVYNKMTITAQKNWNRFEFEDDMPDEVKFVLKRTTDLNKPIDEWDDVAGSEKTLKKEEGDYSKSNEILKWPNLDKTDSSGNTYYYKVVEINVPDDINVSYAYNNWQGYVDATTGSQTVTVTNEWKKTNISMKKQWQDDRGNEANRPNVTFALEQSKDSGPWTRVGTVKFVNDGTGNFKPEGSEGEGSPDIAYTWHGLEAAYNIRYRVVEISMNKSTGEIDTGYDTYYEYTGGSTPKDMRSDGSEYERTSTIINKSTMKQIQVKKEWSGVSGTFRPDRVGYRLYRWTDEEFEKLSEEEKYTDKYVISEKYANKSSNGETDTVNWYWMESVDEYYNTYHYGVKEFYIGMKNVADDGTVTYTEGDGLLSDYEIEVINESSDVFRVKNTWKKLNVSIQKNWEADTNSDKYKSITMKLEQKIGEDGIWTSRSDVDPVTITAADNWKLDNAWTDLPRYTELGREIYYRAVEVEVLMNNATDPIPVEESEDFYTRPDSKGINASGYSVVTNTPKHINVSMEKVWVSPRGNPKPVNLTFTLLASTDGGANFKPANTIDGIDSLGDAKTINAGAPDNQNPTKTAVWEGLPTKTADGKTIIYRIEEGRVEGYGTSYSNEYITSSEKVIITNTETSPYTKKAANPTPSISITKSAATNGGVNLEKIEYNLANDDFLQENVLLSDKLSTVDTAIVDIKGVPTECYLFKWRIDLETNKTDDNSAMTYFFTDTLTDGSVFYNDYGNHGIEMYLRNINGALMYWPNNNWSDEHDWEAFYETHTGYYVANDNMKVIYNNAEKTSVSFDLESLASAKNVSYFTYYTATPKSIVDEAVLSTGEFTLPNLILEKKEEGTEPKKVELKVAGGNDTGYIDKINNTSAGISDQGKQKIQNAVAHYTLDVNKDSKYLSTGNTVNLTDVFRILSYTPVGGTEVTGRDIDLVPTLSNVSVYHYDINGKRTKVDPDKYSYSVEKDDVNGKYEKIMDYSAHYSTANINTDGQGIALNRNGVAIPAGLEVTIKCYGTPGKFTFNPFIGDIKSVAQAKDAYGIDITLLPDEFDSSGTMTMKLVYKNGLKADQNPKISFVKSDAPTVVVLNSSKQASVESSILNSSVETIDYITKFTLPDGGHYEIMYDYDIKLPNGDSVPIGSNLKLQNEAKVHTSGGDKSDESEEAEYVVSQAGAVTQVKKNFTVNKIDVGNKSLKDLNAEFKLAYWDDENSEWIYADKFSYVVHTLVNGKTRVDATLHEASYTKGLTEIDDKIPEESANMVLKGSYEVQVYDKTLYKIIEVKAPDNHPGYNYPKVPYQENDHTVIGNAANTYYYVYGTSDEIKQQLAESAGVDPDSVKSVSTQSQKMTIPNARLIDIGAKKIWEQDPESALNDVQVAVQLLRSDTMSIDDAVPLANQEEYLSDSDKANFDDDMNAYILKKEDSWKQDGIWHNLPNGNLETQQPYYYFIKEVAYKIGDNWYRDKSGSFVDENGEVWIDSYGKAAEYKPSYTDDATNSSGVITVVNSRKLLVKKQWQDNKGNEVANAPVTSIDFNLYGVKEDGTEVRIILPDDRQKLTAPNWQIEVPQELISSEYVKYRVEEVTKLDNYIVSDVYALSGNTGVMYLINKNTIPTDVNVNVTKTWGDGNDLHGTSDAVTIKLYQFEGKQTVNQAFIESFLSAGEVYAGVTLVEEITLDGTESDPWQHNWEHLPYRGGKDNNALQYFITEHQSETTAAKYSAVYTLDGNATYSGERNLDVTNKEPGVLVVKKQWRDLSQINNPLINNAEYDAIQVKLYRKSGKVTIDTEMSDFKDIYGLKDEDLVTGRTDVEGLNEDGTITLSKDNNWTVSLKGLEPNYSYYIEEIDGTTYTIDDYDPTYLNEGQKPGGNQIMVVENYIDGPKINVEAQKEWITPDGVSAPSSITLTLQSYDTVDKKWEDVESKTITASDNWKAVWNEVSATKRYQVIEKVPSGWLVSYGDEIVDTSGDDEIHRFSITNSIDTGKLQVEKKWLDDDSGSVTSVEVEIWRQAYDGDEPYVPVTPNPTPAPANNKWSSSNNLTNPRRIKAAINQTASAVTAENQPEDEQEVTLPQNIISDLALDLSNLPKLLDAEPAPVTLSLKDKIGTDIEFETPYDLNIPNLMSVSLDKAAGAQGTIEIYYEFDKTYQDWNNGGEWVTTHYDDGKFNWDYTDWYLTFTPNYWGGEINVVITGVKWVTNNSDNPNAINDIKFTYIPVPPEIEIDESSVPTSAIIAGDEFTLTATASDGATVSWTSSDTSIATVDASTGKVSFLTAGEEVTITATADDGGLTATDSITLTAVPFAIQKKPTGDQLKVKEGETYKPRTNAAGDVTVSVDKPELATVGADGTVKFTDAGTVTVTVKHGAAEDTVTFTVSNKAFDAELDYPVIHNGMTAAITATVDGKDVTDQVNWELVSAEDANNVTLDGNKITAKVDKATVKLKGTRGDAEPVTIDLVIAPIMIKYNGSEVIPENITTNINSRIPVLNIVGESSGESTDADVAYYDPVKHEIVTTYKTGTAKITINDEGGKLVLNVNVEIQEAESNKPVSAQKVATLTISADDNWKSSVLDELPKTDGNGHTYRYFLVEPKTSEYFAVEYSTSSGGVELADNDKITRTDLMNVASAQDEPVELPETGGEGTKPYAVVGMAIMMLSGTTLYFKRRSRRERKNA